MNDGSGPQDRTAHPAPTSDAVPVDGHAPDGDYATRVSPFVERFAADLTEAGMQRMASRVFACLLASDDGALSSAALAERLRVSPAAVSGAVRYLAQVRMISRERDPGSRRELYRVHTDIWLEAFTNREDHLNRWCASLRTGAEALGTQTAAGRRIMETSEFFQFLKDELRDLMARWHARQAEMRAATRAEPPPGQPG